MATSTFPFCVTEHVIDGQYIREYPRATIPQATSLKLVIKKYTPIDYQEPQPGDVTLVAASGCGFPKELYEPLWVDLLEQSRQNGVRIGSIWIADAANLGASGIENEAVLGNDPSWLDHSRDLLCMINHFRDEMPQPIIGVGHSLGAGQLVLLSLMHPRLLKSLVVIEPVIVPDTFSGHGHILSLKSLKRQDTWPSRSAAIKAAQKTYKTWDPRVLERWIQNGYRNLPTALYPQEGTNENVRPSSDDPSVTLTSSKHQEVMQYVRANFEGHMPLGQEDHTKGRPPHDPLGKPDIVGPSDAIVPFYRSEPLIAWRLLDHIRPSVLYVMGGRSPVSTSRIRSELLHRTGAGIGGSGGLKNLQVKEVVFEKSGHQLPLEQVKETASAIGEWIKPVVQRWKEDEKRIAREWNNQSTRDRLSVPTEWMPALEVICKSLVRSSKM